MKIGYLMIAGTAAFAIGAAATAQTQQDQSGQTGRTQELSRDQSQAPGGPQSSSRSERQEQARSAGMQQGMDPETLKQVQQALNDKGHNAGPVDGIMGPKTQKGLKDFQKAQGMPETGRIDPQTLSALGVQGGQSSVGASSSQRDTTGSATGASQLPESSGGSAAGGSQTPQSSPSTGSSMPPESAPSGSGSSSQ